MARHLEVCVPWHMGHSRNDVCLQDLNVNGRIVDACESKEEQRKEDGFRGLLSLKRCASLNFCSTNLHPVRLETLSFAMLFEQDL